MHASSPSLQRFAAALAALLIAFGCAAAAAGTASAQSAGDEQYTDPLGEDGGGDGDRPTSNQDAQDDPVPPPATTAAPAEPAAPAATETAPTLPRTGGDSTAFAALGLAMLLGGLLLRRQARPT